MSLHTFTNLQLLQIQLKRFDCEFKYFIISLILLMVVTIAIQMVLTYHTVKNFGSQKVWRKGLLQGIGGKNFGEKARVVSVQSIRNKCRPTF